METGRRCPCLGPLVLGRIMHGYGTFLGDEMALATDAYCTYGADIIGEDSGSADGEAMLVIAAH
jgi:hypothetical protein